MDLTRQEGEYLLGIDSNNNRRFIPFFLIARLFSLEDDVFSEKYKSFTSQTMINLSF